MVFIRGGVLIIKGVGIIPNWCKANTSLVVDEVSSFFKSAGVKVINIMEEEKEEDRFGCLAARLEEWQNQIDMIIVVGGDGTILRVGRDLAFWKLPILGINVGNMGFLAELEVQDIPKYLDRVLEGKYSINSRIMLQASVYRQNKEVAAFTALNDAVVTKGPFSRIIHLDAYISGEFFESYTGDGVIVSTPTGSTGYSLSAGGPIIVPGLEVLLFTPICPHSLYNRSVIVDTSETVQIDICTSKPDIVLTVDGQMGFSLIEEDRVFVAKSQHKVNLVTFENRSYFSLLRRKLKE